MRPSKSETGRRAFGSLGLNRLWNTKGNMNNCARGFPGHQQKQPTAIKSFFKLSRLLGFPELLWPHCSHLWCKQDSAHVPAVRSPYANRNWWALEQPALLQWAKRRPYKSALNAWSLFLCHSSATRRLWWKPSRSTDTNLTRLIKFVSVFERKWYFDDQSEPTLVTGKPSFGEFIISLATVCFPDEDGIWYGTWIAKEMLNVGCYCRDASSKNSCAPLVLK